MKGKIISGISIAVLLGAMAVLGFVFRDEISQVVKKEPEIATGLFSDYTDVDVFQNIPAMLVKNTKIGEAVDYGGGSYIIGVDGTSLDDYYTYIAILEEKGFVKYTDNGEEGLEGNIYTTMLTKDSLELTVTQAVHIRKTYIAANDGLELSEHLIYSDDYIKDNKEGAQTTVAILELEKSGNSSVIQLKDGQFIVIDGGEKEDLPNLLDYLESLTPEGEKPVIAAWFITHAHGDHEGAFRELASDKDELARVFVEEIYYSQPGAIVCATQSDSADVPLVVMASKMFTASNGTRTKFYRPQTGQKYYFNDVVVDICFTQEQLILENYSGDMNDASSWFVFNIEGQKYLNAGDADFGSVDTVMRLYEPSYFDIDIFLVFHHGVNVYDRWTDFCTFRTLMYPNTEARSKETSETWAREKENAYMQEQAQEVLAYGDGGKVFTCPYKIGTAKTLPQLWEHEPIVEQ